MLEEEFEIRLKDIEESFSILRFIDSVETHVNSVVQNSTVNENLNLNRRMQQCLRADFIMLLYNAIESTISNCVYALYDAIKDCNLKYGDLREELRAVWIKELIKKDMSLSKNRKVAKNIADNVENRIIELNDLPSNISGNLDFRKILAISSDFGIQFGPIQDSQRISSILLYIKQARNDLAHGNKTFSAIGSMLTFMDLKDYKDKVIVFLRFVINKYEEYINNKEFLYQSQSR